MRCNLILLALLSALLRVCAGEARIPVLTSAGTG
jgi:hypothetical protein